jgi:hypothetical protein
VSRWCRAAAAGQLEVCRRGESRVCVAGVSATRISAGHLQQLAARSNAQCAWLLPTARTRPTAPPLAFWLRSCILPGR